MGARGCDHHAARPDSRTTTAFDRDASLRSSTPACSPDSITGGPPRTDATGAAASCLENHQDDQTHLP